MYLNQTSVELLNKPILYSKTLKAYIKSGFSLSDKSAKKNTLTNEKAVI